MFKEQREDELMLRQNSTEFNAFDSDDDDSKSDAAGELNFDSDAMSEHVSVDL